jgi:hypothetical protein
LASGTSATVTTNGTFDLVDGACSLTARQTEPGKSESGDSTAQVIDVDTALPIGTTPNLKDGSDTGSSSFDNITQGNNPQFDGSASDPTSNGYASGIWKVIVSSDDGNSMTDSTSPFYDVTLTTLNEGNRTVSATVYDVAGNSYTNPTALGVTVDRTAPTLTWGTPTAPNVAGWNNTNVSVPFTTNDALSGVDNSVPPSPLVVTTEGIAVTGTVTVTDLAGNYATFTSAPFNIDKTVPTLTWGTPTAPNAAGWNNTDVTVPFTTNDALSGVDNSLPPSPLVVSTEGIAVTGTVTVTDLAGNNATFTSAPFNIDKTVPTVKNVVVSSTHWDSTFLSSLALLSSKNVGGYSIPVGGGAQLVALPWGNINQIKVVFSENVMVDPSDLLLAGVNTTAYNVSGATFDYDSTTCTATWTLPQALGPDKLLLALNADGSDPIKDSAGNRLDGEWTNPTSTTDTGGSAFPSGNGTAGGNFLFRFNALPGDATSDGYVTAADLGRLLANFNGPGTYTASQGDFTGDGKVTAADLGVLLADFNRTLPQPEPVPVPFPTGDSLTPAVVPTAISVSSHLATTQPAYLLSGPQPIAPRSLLAHVATGQSTSQKLTQVAFVVGARPGSSLGEAVGNRIDLNTKAAGNGWFGDSTPASKERVTPAQNNQPLQAVDPRAVDKIDLLTVTEHELGHAAGLNGLDALTDDVMSGVLGTGIRRNAVHTDAALAS